MKPEPVPSEVREAFPNACDQLAVLHQRLASTGVERGLIGPREVPRLWDRHILNCAVVTELIPQSAQELADVGSGAGLPGLVLAVVRPDLAVTLIEPLERRSLFLSEVVDEMDLGDRVEVLRARAEDIRGRQFAVVTARAVAPLERLCGWCLPLLPPGGRLLAIKGARAHEEVAVARQTLETMDFRVELCGTDIIDPPTTVVVLDVAGSTHSHPTAAHQRNDRQLKQG